MSLPASSYTPPGGYTPQARAVANSAPTPATSQAPANTGNMMSQISNGQELDPTQLSSLTGAYGNATEQLGNMQTSPARQGYVDNSNIPAMQSNYDDLAKKLFDYDTGVLNPQFSGTNPGMPTDAAAFGRVDASPLAMTVNSSQLPSSGGLFVGSSNPKYALSSQVDQSNNIVDLLNTLNSSIGQEFNQRAGTYTNTVDKQQTLLKSIADILDQNRQTSLTKAQISAENARSAASIQEQRYEKMLELGYIDPTTGQPLSVGQRSTANAGGSTGNAGIDATRQSLQDQFNSLPANSPLRGKIASAWKAAHNTPLFPGALTDKQVDQLNSTTDFLRLLDRVQTSLDGMKKNGQLSGGLVGGIAPVEQFLLQHGGAAGGMVNGPKGDMLRDLLLLQGMSDRKLMGGRLIKDLVIRFGGAFPSGYQDSGTIQNRINTMRQDAVSDLKTYASTQGYNDPQQFLKDHQVDDIQINPGSKGSGSTMMTGPDGKKWNVPADKIDVFKKNGYR